MDVSIVTPEKEIWSGSADLVVGRSPEGEFGIMRSHIPFLAALVPGTIAVSSGGSRRNFIVPGGFLEASGSRDDYHVIVLADAAEDAGDIDPAGARRRAEEMARAMVTAAEGDGAEDRIKAALESSASGVGG